MNNAILSLAFLLNTDDAMVVVLQHLHVKEQHASEKDVFVSMMLAMSIVGKYSDFKRRSASTEVRRPGVLFIDVGYVH